MARLEFDTVDEIYEYLQKAHGALPQEVVDAAYRFRNFCKEFYKGGDYDNSILMWAFQDIGPSKYKHSISEPARVRKGFEITAKQATRSVYHNDTETSHSLRVVWKGFRGEALGQDLPYDKPRKKAKDGHKAA